MTFDQFCQLQIDSIENVLARIEPQDDLVPILVIETDQKEPLLFPLQNFGYAKEHLANVIIPGLLREHNAVRGSLCFAAWMSNLKPGCTGITDVMPPSKDPDRIEVVSLITFKSGEERHYTGILTREDSKPPSVTWSEPSLRTGGLFSGFSRFLKSPS